jgi:[acyl-carrier-protein] S-malonyltransferase
MTAFLFPGQGSQKPGMGRDFLEQAPETAPYFEAAEAAVPGIRAIMFDGPAEELAATQRAQVALLTVSAAAVHVLRARGVEPDACAGHSLGEFSALYAAGALTFDDAVRLVAARGRCMSQDVPDGAMAAVVGLDADTIAAHLPEGVSVANYNGPGQTILSGTRDGIAAAEAAMKGAGAKRVLPLAVSGPFHSPLMAKAAEAFRRELEGVAIAKPACRFVSSVSGRDEDDPGRIRALLGEQICAPVRWTDVMTALGFVPALEAGAGKVLQGLAKRTEGAPDVRLAGTIDDINALEA